MDKELKKQLKKYSEIFIDAQEKNKKEADVVMYLVQFFQDALAYDLFKEISQEHKIKDKFCDIAIKIKGEIKLLIEAKQPGIRLADRHIDYAESYGAKSGTKWVLLTNGCDWKLFHLSFDEEEGIDRSLAFKTDLVKSFQNKPKDVIEKFILLHRKSLIKGELEKFWKKRTLLIPRSLTRVLFKEEILKKIRQEVNRGEDVKVGIEDVAKALKNMIDKEVLAEMADIKIVKGKSTKHEKPYKVIFLNKIYEIKTWKELLILIAKKLMELKPDLMRELSDSEIVQGRKSPYLTKNKALLRNPYQLSPGLFLETNLSSDGVIKVIKILLKVCGYKDSDIEIKTKK